MAMGMLVRLTAASMSFRRYTGLAYWRAPLEICSITGAFSSSQASTIACSSSMLFTLKAPRAYFPFSALANRSLVCVSGIVSFFGFWVEPGSQPRLQAWVDIRNRRTKGKQNPALRVRTKGHILKHLTGGNGENREPESIMPLRLCFFRAAG